ncbi:MAG: adenine phosphoribosyltransferase [Eubacteriales bacterium]|nr:adenine phosphoribosyltransferase [Eubacteriales bacterium]
MKRENVEAYIRTIPDFPEEGIMFRDITTVLQDEDGLRMAVDQLSELVKDIDFDLIVGLESRGFIFGVPMAYKLGKGFIPVRKKGKLPAETVSAKYDLEYGQAEIEIHKDAIKPGQKVVIVDDLIATGGTCEATCKLIEELGGEVVKICFLIELCGLNGREKLSKYDVASLIQYPGK